ncbi:hypothetical protein ILYODFUR_036137 [Ilyodon furcidens]|uniref:Uncharacterized protein n=1 Tax=Ilyodon furcidens TaxID=33524 RepID=A0ABV0UF81_9TELE
MATLPLLSAALLTPGAGVVASSIWWTGRGTVLKLVFGSLSVSFWTPLSSRILRGCLLLPPVGRQEAPVEGEVMSGLCVGAQCMCVCFFPPSALERFLAGAADQGLITGLLKELRPGGKRQPVATFLWY